MAMNALPRPAVFLDKDGTLVENVPYNVDPALLAFTPGALEGLRILAANGFALVVVSNQPGVALGYFDRRDWVKLRDALIARIRVESGVVLDDVVMCPHAPAEDGSPACLCRKPAPGMLRAAAARHNLDLSRSWMVGDILDDVEAGKRAGCRSLLLDVGHETVWRLSPLRTPESRLTDLRAAAAWIVAHSETPAPRCAATA